MANHLSNGKDRLRDLIPAYERYLRLERQVAPRTIKNRHSYTLTSVFVPWCEEQGAERFEDLDEVLLDGFSQELTRRRNRRGDPIARDTRHSYLQSVKGFLEWGRGKLQAGPGGEKIGLPRLRKVKREILMEGEYRRLEDAAPTERDKLILRVLWETAAREGEIAALRVTDLVVRDRRYYFIVVRGKTGERMPPISAELHRRLTAYATGKSGRPRSSSSTLFLSERRRHGEFLGLTESGILQAIHNAVELAEDLDRRIYVHLLRHTAITRMLTKGVDPVTVSINTGVSLRVISEHYMHPTDDQRWESMRNLLSGS